MSNIEQGPSSGLSKREALNQALGCAIGKVAHPFSGEKAEQLQSTLTRPITADDAKAAGMATLHTAKDLPFALVKDINLGARDVVLQSLLALSSPFTAATRCFRSNLEGQRARQDLPVALVKEPIIHTRNAALKLMSVFLAPVTTTSRRFQSNFKDQKAKIEQ